VQDAWEAVRQHASDTQAKYQINWANPDKREQAIISRELAVEKGLVEKAMRSDTARTEWMKTQKKNLTSFLRNASDEELAVVFGPDVANARQNSKSRDLQESALKLQEQQLLGDKDTADKFLSTLAAQSMSKAFEFAMKFAGTDKSGNPIWGSEAYSKAVDQVPGAKTALDVMNAYFGIPMVGVASPTRTEIPKVFGIFGGGTKWSYTSPFSAAPAAVPTTSADSAADAYLSGRK